jgi:hypothetical protein
MDNLLILQEEVGQLKTWSLLEDNPYHKQKISGPSGKLIHILSLVSCRFCLGQPAITCEAHRSRQLYCHSRCLILSGTQAMASASRFLPEMCIGSPLPVREPTSFQQRRKQDGYQQQTREHAAMRQHQSDDLAECQRERSILLNDLLPTIQGSIWSMAQWDFVRSQ